MPLASHGESLGDPARGPRASIDGNGVRHCSTAAEADQCRRRPRRPGPGRFRRHARAETACGDTRPAGSGRAPPPRPCSEPAAQGTRTRLASPRRTSGPNSDPRRVRSSARPGRESGPSAAPSARRARGCWTDRNVFVLLQQRLTQGRRAHVADRRSAQWPDARRSPRRLRSGPPPTGSFVSRCCNRPRPARTRRPPAAEGPTIRRTRRDLQTFRRDTTPRA